MRDRRREAGFSLVELMVVVLIVGLLASIAVPVLNRSLQKANRTATAAEMRHLYVAMSRYYADNGSYAVLDTTTFEPLVSGGYLDDADSLLSRFEGEAVLKYIALGTGGWWMVIRPKGDAGSLIYTGQVQLNSGLTTVLWDGVYWYNASEGHTALVRIDGSQG